MFGWRWMHQREIDALTSQIAKLEKLAEYWQRRADDERDRADRLNDGLLQQNGLPATTNTVRRESESERDRMKTEQEHRMREVAEIYGETNGMMEEMGLELPPELKAEADKMIAGLTQSET